MNVGGAELGAQDTAEELVSKDMSIRSHLNIPLEIDL